MTDDILEEKLQSFKNRFEFESDKIKSQVHYQSAINVTKQLIIVSNKKETEPYKLSAAEFFNRIENLDFPLGKSEFLELYKNYLLNAGKYLIQKKDFRSSWDILKYIGIGILLDFILYYLTKTLVGFYLPIFTLIFVILGFRSQKIKKTNMQYFGIGY